MSEIDAIFVLLGAAMRHERCGALELNAAQWWRLFRMAQQHHVAALLAETLPEGMPREVLIPWLSERQKVEQRLRYQQEVQHDIVDLMQRHGIDTLVLKGTRLAALYPKPGLREFGDLDLYFYDRHDEADRVAQENLHVAIDHHSHHHTRYLYRGITVESHYDLLNRHTPPSNRRYEARLKAAAPSATFEAMFLLRHMAVHFAASHITLRDLCDWHVASAQPVIDWEAVAQAVAEGGTEPFAAAVEHIAATRLGTPLRLPFRCDEATARRVEADILQGPLPDHPDENWGRLLWKLRRYRANGWKRRLAFSHDSAPVILAGSIAAHALKPKNILHKM